MNALSKFVGVALLSICLLGPPPTLAAGGAKSSDGPQAVVDLLIVRPYLLLKSAVASSCTAKRCLPAACAKYH
mgnify:CR=1 FL=1|jgi:hypothetical protein